METAAVKRVFNGAAAALPLSSIKSMIGHLIGAAGAVEAVALALTLHDGVLPPTINQTTPDPECDLDYVPNCAREYPVRVGRLHELRLRRPECGAGDAAVRRLSATHRPPKACSRDAESSERSAELQTRSAPVGLRVAATQYVSWNLCHASPWALVLSALVERCFGWYSGLGFG